MRINDEGCTQTTVNRIQQFISLFTRRIGTKEEKPFESRESLLGSFMSFAQITINLTNIRKHVYVCTYTEEKQNDEKYKSDKKKR